MLYGYFKKIQVNNIIFATVFNPIKPFVQFWVE